MFRKRWGMARSFWFALKRSRHDEEPLIISRAGLILFPMVILLGACTNFVPVYPSTVTAIYHFSLKIDGPGYFRLMDSNQSLFYSRDGHFIVDGERDDMRNPSGLLLTPPISLPPHFAGNTWLSPDGKGVIWISLPPSTNSNIIGNFLLYNFQQASKLRSVGSGLYAETGDSGAAVPGSPGNPGYGKVYSATDSLVATNSL